MKLDPIVEETREVREKILADCDGDLDKLLDRYKSAESEDQSRLVTLEAVRQRRKVTGRSDPRSQ